MLTAYVDLLVRPYRACLQCNKFILGTDRYRALGTLIFVSLKPFHKLTDEWRGAPRLVRVSRSRHVVQRILQSHINQRYLTASSSCSHGTEVTPEEENFRGNWALISEYKISRYQNSPHSLICRTHGDLIDDFRFLTKWRATTSYLAMNKIEEWKVLLQNVTD